MQQQINFEKLERDINEIRTRVFEILKHQNPRKYLEILGKLNSSSNENEH